MFVSHRNRREKLSSLACKMTYTCRAPYIKKIYLDNITLFLIELCFEIMQICNIKKKIFNIYFIFETYCYDLRGSCSWESKKSPFDDEKFIYRRNFSVKQAPSAEVIYNYAIQTQRSTANSKENPTQRYYLS